GAFVHAGALQAADVLAVMQQALGAGQVEQGAALVEGGRNGGDQHRLLGVDRAAHAAVAEVPAAAHVARDDLPGVAEPVAAAADHGVVGVWRDGPGCHAQTLLHLREPGRHGLGAVAFYAVGLGPVL